MILKDGNKIQRNLSGEVLNDAANASSKILDINTGVIQFRNRLAKDANNNVSKIMDSANNHAFENISGNPAYSYDEHFNFDSGGFRSRKEIFLDGGENMAFEFWFRTSDVGTTAIKVLYSHNGSEGLNFQCYFNTGRFVSNPFGTFDPSLTGDALVNNKWYHLSYVIGGGARWTFLDGELREFASLTRNFSKTNYFSLGVDYNGANLCTDIDIKNFTLYNDYPIPSLNASHIGTQVFTPKQPFTWYKKYQNKDGHKKLFLTSRYLENAVIGNDNKITSLKSEVGDTVANTIPATEPYWDKQGFKFNTLTSRLSLNDSAFIYGSDNFTWNMYAMRDQLTKKHAFVLSNGQSGGYTLGVTLKYDNTVQVYISSDGSSFDYSPSFAATIIANRWYNVTIVRITDTLYVLLDGKLIGTIALSTGYVFNASSQVYLGTWQSSPTNGLSGYMDDILFSKVAEIDPTGYAVGEKVFQPDLRKSLNINEDTPLIQFIN